MLNRYAMSLCATAALSLMTSRGATAADKIWAGGDGNWGVATAWTGGMPGNDDVASFTGGKSATVTLDTDSTAAGLTFSTAGAAVVTIAGEHTLTIADGGVIKKSASSTPTNQTISVPVTLAGSATFTNDNGWVHMANQLIIAGPVSGSGAVEIAGTGNGGVAFSADNSQTFHGTITVTSGTLLVNNANALGDTASGTRMTGGEILFAGVNTAEPFEIGGKSSWESLNPNEHSGAIQLESGAAWTIGNGGGNALTLSGALSGAADSQIIMTCGNTTLAGSDANTFAGSIAHAANSENAVYDELRLAKPAGVTAIAGPLAVTNKAAVLWKADDQIDDAAAFTLGGGVLKPQGHHDKLGVLTLTGRSRIDFTGGGTLAFAGSSAATWADKSQLLVSHWEPSAKLSIGDSASGLTPQQVAMIGFTDPAGKSGLYRAKLATDGTLQPGDSAVAPSGIAYDVSPVAQVKRAKLYEVHGLQRLVATPTPLKQGDVVDFFGDSITWLNGWASTIEKTVAESPATSGLGVTFHNHGVNGGGAAQIRDGSPKAAFDGQGNDAPQAPFADVIAADHATLAVLFIGINDVWWRNTTPDDFRKQLIDIAASAAKQGTKLAIATMAVHGELPDGKNADDAKIEQFAQITRDVAKQAGVPLIDLRKAYTAYEQNHNGELQLDGTLLSRPSGLLTYDSVHPTAQGNALLADMIADGLARAAAGR